MELTDGAQAPRFLGDRLKDKFKTADSARKLSRAEAEGIYAEDAAPVFNFLFYKLGDKYAAEDLTSEVFIKVIEKYGLYNAQKGGLKTWIFAVARNALKDYFKISRKRAALSLDTDGLGALPADGGTEETVMRRIETAELIDALKCLSDRERDIISLKYGAGLRNKDIAAQCGVSEKNAGVILARAIKKLRKQMEAETYEK